MILNHLALEGKQELAGEKCSFKLYYIQEIVLTY